MEMLNAENFINFMRAQVTERERQSKRSALDTQSSHVVGSNTSPNTIKEKQHG
jgi:hypothetical protein